MIEKDQPRSGQFLTPPKGLGAQCIATSWSNIRGSGAMTLSPWMHGGVTWTNKITRSQIPSLERPKYWSLFPQYFFTNSQFAHELGILLACF